jgi:hypothetical protein
MNNSATAFARQPGNLCFLRCQVITRLVRAPANRLAGREQLATRALGEGHRAHLGEHLVGDPQLAPRIHAAVRRC